MGTAPSTSSADADGSLTAVGAPTKQGSLISMPSIGLEVSVKEGMSFQQVVSFNEDVNFNEGASDDMGLDRVESVQREMRRMESRRHFVNRSRVVQHPSANLFTENTSGLLDRSLDELQPLLWYKCDVCRPSGPYTDNDRVPMRWEMSDGANPETPRLALQKHKGQAFNFFCQICGRKCHEIRLVDTFEKLFRDFRGIVTNDPALPLVYDPDMVDADIPGDAGFCCELAHKFKVEEHLTDETLSEIAVSLSAGALRKRLNEKMKGAEAEHGCRYKSYIRIGIGLKALGPITAVLEMWPTGHSSPKHEHGGCAGCVRVIFGKIHVKLYRRLDIEDDPIEIPGVTQEGGVIEMQAPVTTWMNRENWYIHEVSSPEDNEMGFALSVHVYRAATDEFAFAHEDYIQKCNPGNDFFWNIDLPAGDPRAHSIRDFRSFLSVPDYGRPAAEAWCTDAERQGELSKKKWAYLKALESDSTYGPAWMGLGSSGGCDQIEGIPGIKDGAYSSKLCFQKALECDPRLAAAWVGLGFEGGTDADKPGCSPKECFQEALQIDPKFALAWAGLASKGGGMVKGVYHDEQACRNLAGKDGQQAQQVIEVQKAQPNKIEADVGDCSPKNLPRRGSNSMVERLALLMKCGGTLPKA